MKNALSTAGLEEKVNEIYYFIKNAGVSIKTALFFKKYFIDNYINVPWVSEEQKYLGLNYFIDYISNIHNLISILDEFDMHNHIADELERAECKIGLKTLDTGPCIESVADLNDYLNEVAA